MASMGSETYSVYEAKARFSEILRKVRSGRSVVITHHGVGAARIVPYVEEETLEGRLARLESEGLTTAPRGEISRFRPVASRPGAVRRFLDERE